MKFKFKNQSFQKDATDAVCDVFEGQPYRNPNVYTAAPGNWNAGDRGTLALPDDPEVGFKNAEITLPDEVLLANIQTVQRRTNLELSTLRLTEDHREKTLYAPLPELDVEMETGTGKTFVYTKTIFELNRRYGWSKFIVVVPSVAIREGVKNSFEDTAEKFGADYGKTAKVYVYNSAHLQDVQEFSTNPGIQVMVMNVQAFAAEGRGSTAARRIHMELDEFGSRRPIDMIAANRPILIMDEPQKMEGEKTREKLKDFKPLAILRYSATHKTIHNLVYRLDAIDAFEQKLVKKIEPVCIDVTNRNGAHSYVYCSEICKNGTAPKSRLEFQLRRKDGTIVYEKRLVRKGDDLYALSKKLEAYRDRYRVIDLNAKDGYGRVEFENGLTLVPGEAAGDVLDDTFRRLQIREAVKAHLDKEQTLFQRGIKVLTLFFIDAVKNYRVYADDKDEKGSDGKYAAWFEEEYAEEVKRRLETKTLDSGLRRYWERITPAKTHNGYFAKDGKRRIVDSKEKDGGSEDDKTAYDLILKDKKRLLSFDEDTRFIFSHSALREGWDNPNVFVMCPLKRPEIDNEVTRRQEIGRGLRLCVDQNGERQDDPATVHEVNILTIVANEEFSTYVDGLQKEIETSCKHRPALADIAFFADKVLKATIKVVVDGREVEKTEEHKISEVEAKTINFWLKTNGYVDMDDAILPKWREAREGGSVSDLPPTLANLNPFAGNLLLLVDSVLDPSAIKKFTGAKSSLSLSPNSNFYKKEFQELWGRINHKSTYTVEFSSDELVKKAVAALEGIVIPKLTYTIRHGMQTAGNAFVRDNKPHVETVDGRSVDTGVKYDLVGKVAEGTVLTRKTVCRILKGIKPACFDQFGNNPEKFIAEVVRIVNEQKATMIVAHIRYNILEDTYSSDVFTKNQVVFPEQMVPIRDDRKPLQKHIYDWLKSDSIRERNFAKELDTSAAVVVYAKLPRDFFIPTPVGEYNPDWAIAFEVGSVKHVYFVAETKGSLSDMQLRQIEKDKIECAKKFFFALGEKDVKYHVTYEKVASYQDLINMANSEDPDSDV